MSVDRENWRRLFPGPTLELKMPRTTREVFEDHLALRRNGHEFLDSDIEQNYADDVVILSNYGMFRGKAGVRECAGILKREVPDTQYDYTVRLVHGDVAYLEWRALNVKDGVDTFVIRDGKIVVQTIRYTPTGPM